MQQKVQFLGTIVHDPEILILDEPFSGLDPINVVLVKDFLTEFKKQRKDGRLLDARPRAGRAALRQDRAPLPRRRSSSTAPSKEIKHAYRDRVPLPPPVEPEPELEKIFIKCVQESGLEAPTAEELK